MLTPGTGKLCETRFKASELYVGGDISWYRDSARFRKEELSVHKYSHPAIIAADNSGIHREEQIRANAQCFCSSQPKRCLDSIS